MEAAQSMGATPFQIITKVMIPECLPGLISSMTTALTTILGYSAMSGVIGGGGLGKIALSYGYYRYQTNIMIVCVVLLVLMVQVFQTVGTLWATRSDKRLKVSFWGPFLFSQGIKFNESIPRRRLMPSAGNCAIQTNPVKEYVAMNRDTICVQGGYTPRQRRTPPDPHHPVHYVQVRYQRGHGQAVRPRGRRLLLLPPAEPHLRSWWRKRSASWRAAPPPC